MEDKGNKSGLTVADIICRWYICAVVGFVVGKNLGGSFAGAVGFVIGGIIGWFLQKNYNKNNE